MPEGSKKPIKDLVAPLHDPAGFSSA